MRTTRPRIGAGLALTARSDFDCAPAQCSTRPTPGGYGLRLTDLCRSPFEPRAQLRPNRRLRGREDAGATLHRALTASMTSSSLPKFDSAYDAVDVGFGWPSYTAAACRFVMLGAEMMSSRSRYSCET